MAPPDAAVEDRGARRALRGAKDRALEFALRATLNRRFRAFGEITALDIDTGTRQARARLQLRGEPEPIVVALDHYRLDRRDDVDWLTVGAATASREWVSAALHALLVGRSFPIPGRAAAALHLLA